MYILLVLQYVLLENSWGGGGAQSGSSARDAMDNAETFDIDDIERKVSYFNRFKLALMIKTHQRQFVHEPCLFLCMASTLAALLRTLKLLRRGLGKLEMITSYSAFSFVVSNLVLN